MATFTITTPVNIDSLASKAGSDTYNINGGYLTVDQDTRYGTNQNTSAPMGNITLSATLGGTVEFNATAVRLIPYNSGSGNVPAYDTVISQGGASGKLIGVYSALNVAPTAPASAMPASGYIKIRQWNAVSYSAGALTGIGASATAVDRAGWLEIVGVDALTVTVNRLNLFKVRGDWFDFLGVTTDGTRATTYQIPSNGTLQYHAGVWVETGTSTDVYEFYPCAGSLTALLANVGTDAVRGKVCWISSAGLVRFGHDGTNSTGGYIPPSGRRIRMPNIFFATCISAGLTVNVLPNATLATRYEFATTGGGVIDIDKASISWYMNINQPFSVGLTNVGILTNLTVTECASPIAWDNVGVGQEGANSQFALVMSLNFAGGTMNKCTWSRSALGSTGNYVVSMADVSGLTITNERTFSFVKSANATTGSYTLTRVASTTWTGTILGGGRVVLVTCTDVTFTTTTYYDHPALTTGTAMPMYMFDMSSNCLRVKMDGVDFGGLTLVQPYSGILSVGSAGCTDIKLRNIGSYASPLDMGGAQQDGVSWSRTTTTATVTKTAHGLKTNDIVYVLISSDISAIVVGSKTVASAPTADTFTFTALNAGATSGTLTYYPTMSALLFALATGCASNTVRVQRCYTTHLRTNLYTGDNSSKNIYVENTLGDYINAPLVPMLNMYNKGIASTPVLTAQTSVYGSHWLDTYIHGIVANRSAVAWARTTTVATITSTGHGLRTGMLINVTVTSDAGAIILGQKTITATTPNAFTFTCLNAGGTSGTLTFVPYSGRVAIQMNESTADTTDQYTIDSGTPAFTSAGGFYMPVIGQQVTFITPSYILGHNAFPIAEVVMAGGTLTNYEVTYQIDKGSGYSASKNLSYPRAGGGGSNASTTVTMTSTTGVNVGDYVFGTNINTNCKVVSIDSGTNITVDRANIGTVSGILRFNQLPNETSITSTGFKMKVTIRTSTTNATAMTSLYIITDSDNTSRAYQYLLDPKVALTLNGLVTGSDIVILSAGTDTELVNVDANSGTTYTYDYDYVASTYVDIGVFLAGYVPFYIRNYLLGSTDGSLPVAQIADRNYLL